MSVPRTSSMRWRRAAPLILVAAALTATALAVAPAGQAATAASPGWLPATPSGWSTVVTRTVGADRPVTQGVTVHSDVLDTVTGRVPGQVLEVDASDPNVRLGVVGAGDKVIDPADERITSMAARTGAVAGINGGYFDINASGQPTGGEIVDGSIWKSPQHGFNGTFSVRADGTSTIGPEEFSGTITDGAATHDLYSINWPGDAAGDRITEITDRLGGSAAVAAGSTYVHGTSTDGRTITVTAVDTVSSLPTPGAGTAGLLGSGAGGAWLAANLHVGDTVSLTAHTAPDDGLRQLLQGPGQLVKDGQVFTDPANTDPSGLNPETMIGVSKDGEHVYMVALDGRGTESTAVGVTPAQAAGYMVDLGVDAAVLLDGGGSTGLVARNPGQTAATIQNTPSDSVGERPVGNGIFVYSTATTTGEPASASLNGGKPVATAVGVPVAAPAIVTDAVGNPAADSRLQVTVTPERLGTWAHDTFTPAAAGTGVLRLTDGRATKTVKVTVDGSFASLAISPSAPDLAAGATAQLTLTGTTASGAIVPVPATAATWSVDSTTYGAIDPATGVFTATDAVGIANVTATVDGAKATASVAVGSRSVELDSFADSSTWTWAPKGGASATVSTDTDVPPGSTHATSSRADYAMPVPGTSTVHQLVVSPQGRTITVDTNAGQAPTAIAVWIKVDDPVHDTLQLATNYVQGNGSSATLYNTGLEFGHWQRLVTQLPAGTVFPLKLGYLDLLTIKATKASGGTVHVGGLDALYAARPIAQGSYTAIPQNPAWLQYGTPEDFPAGGQTILLGDDAHMTAANSDGASSHVMDDIAARVKGTPLTTADGQTVAPLPANARPNVVQMLGDMSDDGKDADLQFAKDKIAAIGAPYHDLVGNHEITQGSDAEDKNFTKYFGDTHYRYTAGAATVIALDNGHSGITASDPNQIPADQKMQYPWLVQQLDATTTPVVIVAVHMPAYDPFPAKNSQFTDRWEAQQYLQLVTDYRNTHPGTHVLMVYGHARGFSEQILDPDGTAATDGVPQFVFGDLGMPAYTAPEQGGFYHFGLMNIASDGTVRFAVEPVLQQLTIDPVATADLAAGTASDARTLTEGDSVTLTAHGVNQTAGPNATLPLDPVTVPIAAPVSHTWASSDPKVARVDARTGVVTARTAGTATISLQAGGITTTVELTVAPAQHGGGHGGSGGNHGGGDGGGHGDDHSHGHDDGWLADLLGGLFSTLF